MKKQKRLATWLGILIGAAGGILFAGRAWASEPLTEEFHKTYVLSADGRVSLENINGAVTITGWDRNEVQVDAIKRAKRKDRLDEAKIVVESNANTISIHTEYPQHDHNFNWGDDNNPASVDYTLHVPRHARLDQVDLVNGSLEIHEVAGDVHASSVNGRVLAKDLAGRADLSTVNGRTEAEFRQLPKSHIHASSVNGSVLVTIPSDANADIHASTVSGGIETDFGFNVHKASMIGHSLDGRLGTGGTEIELSDVNGTIELRHAHDGKTISTATGSNHKSKDDDDGDTI
jgi:DUF4097 and DUF4098 domain-containing protein YvlB